ncbi:MAG: sulfotransferase [Cyclobacteriaceae bacterium]|nr:sulfotransferase [Cyclobacteriaceae bacterium HetDA_MAG_MS6]
MEIKRPNFFVIGAGKSGTTTLYHSLSQHPQVYLTPTKETNYFALKGRKLPKGPDPDQKFHFPGSITDKAHYLAQFQGCQQQHLAIGEVCPMYLYSDVAAKNIKEFNPQAKIIAILRQPSQRLYSRYMHLVRERREPKDSLLQIFDEKSIWWERKDLIPEGFYHMHLSSYFKLFDNDQILVLLYDDLVYDKEGTLQSIFRHLEIDEEFRPTLDIVFNKSGKINSRFVDWWIGQNSVPKQIIQSLAPALFNHLKRTQTMKKWVTHFRNRNLKSNPAPSGLLRKLTDSVYKQDILRLEGLLQKDLSPWLT